MLHTVTVRKDGAIYRIRHLSFDEVKELLGVNGHGPTKSLFTSVSTSSSRLSAAPVRPYPDFKGFLGTVSERGREFLTIVKQNPDGIEANALAGKLGYQDARQIGGLTGGGLAKVAKQFHIRLRDVYRTDVTFPNGKRTRMFRAGKFIHDWIDEEKPAV